MTIQRVPGVDTYEGERKIAAQILLGAIEAAKAGNLDARAYLLHSKQASVFLDAWGIDPQAAREKLLLVWQTPGRPSEPTMTTAQVAKAVGITKATVIDLIDDGTLIAEKVCGTWRVRVSDYNRFAATYRRHYNRKAARYE